MKIDELLGVKKFANLTADEIVAQLEKMGGTDVEVLGQGETGVAISIGGNVYKMWMVDSGYSAFVDYALKHQDNPFLPKFKGGVKKLPAFFIRSDKAPDFVNYIRVERLQEIDYDDLDKMDFDNGSGKPVNLTMFLSYIRFYGAEDIDKVVEKMDIQPDASPKLKLFISTITDIMRLVNKKQNADLHAKNMMMRGDQLVIIDPIASKADMKINRAFKEFTKTIRAIKPPKRSTKK